MIKNHKIVKYRITGAFGTLDEGEIINAVLLYEGGGRKGLIYHPKTPKECPSIEICHREPHSDIWESLVPDGEEYINVDTKWKQFQDQLLGKRFKWKREFYDI